jgi:glutathione S-transferase
MYRRNAKVPYPKPYADSGDHSAADAETKKAQYLWNCAQRAHGNYLEVQPSVALSLLISGVQYPVTAAALGSVWIVGRYVIVVALDDGR